MSASSKINAHHDVAKADRDYSGSRIDCLDCHGAHLASNVKPLVNPFSPNQAWTAGTSQFCLTCHTAGTGTSKHITRAECGGCHASHGSQNIFHINSTVNGMSGISVTNGNTVKNVCSSCHSGAVSDWHLTCWNTCHSDTAMYSPDILPGEGSDCMTCHLHGKAWTHTGTCLNCHGVFELHIYGFDGPFLPVVYPNMF